MDPPKRQKSPMESFLNYDAAQLVIAKLDPASRVAFSLTCHAALYHVKLVRKHIIAPRAMEKVRLEVARTQLRARFGAEVIVDAILKLKAARETDPLAVFSHPGPDVRFVNHFYRPHDAFYNSPRESLVVPLSYCGGFLDVWAVLFALMYSLRPDLNEVEICIFSNSDDELFDSHAMFIVTLDDMWYERVDSASGVLKNPHEEYSFYVFALVRALNRHGFRCT